MGNLRCKHICLNGLRYYLPERRTPCVAISGRCVMIWLIVRQHLLSRPAELKATTAPPASDAQLRIMYIMLNIGFQWASRDFARCRVETLSKLFFRGTGLIIVAPAFFLDSGTSKLVT